MKVRVLILASSAWLWAPIVTGSASAQTAPTPAAEPVVASDAPVQANQATTSSQAASSPETQSAPSPTDTASGGLADIVVTAQRRSENLQRVPIAVTAASGQELAASGITSTVQLNTVAPGLNVRVTNGSFNPFVRGIGTSSNIVENPVALYIDGVYIPQQREGLRELNDIEQLAVLKGPQGTLFGRNATGGVIQITTRAPSHTFSAEAGAELDNYLTLRSDAYVTGPISDTLAFSLSGQYDKQFEGYGKNYTTGNDTYELQHQVGVRGKLLFEPTATTKLTLIADYIERNDRSNSWQPLTGTKFAIPGFGPVHNRYDTYSGVDPYTEFKGGGISLNAEQELGFARLVSITAYRRGDAENLLSPSSDPGNSFLVQSYSNPSNSFSQELQLLSRPGRLSWVVGAFYFHSRNANLPVSIDFAGPFAATPFSAKAIDNYGDERATSAAPFAQVNWKPFESTTLTGGIRWTYEERSALLSRTITLNNGFLVAQPAIDPNVTFRKFSYRAVLSHDFSPNILGYVSYNTGFKSGGFNITNRDNASYLPEELKATEVGLKSQLFDRRIRLNLAAYYYDYTNLQVTQFSNGTQTVGNGAAAKLYGLDVDLEAQLAHGLKFTSGLALEHTEFTNYPNAVIETPGPNGSVVLASGSAKGNRLPLAQNVSATAALDYHRDLTRGSFDANTTFNYNGDYYFEASNGALRQGPYTILNASLRYSFPGDKFSIGVFGRNLLDESILSFPVTQTFGYDANYAPPRTFGIAFRVRM